MFNIATNRVAVYEDLQSVTNRTKLLILSARQELYNNPDFGVGLNKYIWQYNTVNTRAILEKEIKDQLALHEPCAVPEETIFSDGLKYSADPITGQSTSTAPGTDLKLTVAVTTKFGSKVSIDLNSEYSQ